MDFLLSGLIRMTAEPDNSGELLKNPVSLIALVVLFAGVLIILGFRRIKFTPRLMTSIALSVAIAAVLNNIKFLSLPQGGSITLVSMLPIFLMAFAYGPEIGFLTGFLFGMINLFMGPYILHPVQVLFDYPLPFMLLGVAGYFPRQGTVGILTGGFLRFLCHVISGAVFFGSYAPAGMNVILYSIVYNAPIVFIELALIIIIMFILPVNRLLKAMNPHAPEFKMFSTMRDAR